MQEAFNKSQIKYPSIKKNTLRKFTSSEKYVVTLRYGEEQTLTLDGKNYVDPNNSAINEIKYKELPYKVAINEALEISKKYGEETSRNFINGILASVVKEQIAE